MRTGSMVGVGNSLNYHLLNVPGNVKTGLHIFPHHPHFFPCYSKHTLCTNLLPPLLNPPPPQISLYPHLSVYDVSLVLLPALIAPSICSLACWVRRQQHPSIAWRPSWSWWLHWIPKVACLTSRGWKNWCPFPYIQERDGQKCSYSGIGILSLFTPPPPFCNLAQTLDITMKKWEIPAGISTWQEIPSIHTAPLQPPYLLQLKWDSWYLIASPFGEDCSWPMKLLLSAPAFLVPLWPTGPPTLLCLYNLCYTNFLWRTC